MNDDLAAIWTVIKLSQFHLGSSDEHLTWSYNPINSRLNKNRRLYLYGMRHGRFEPDICFDEMILPENILKYISTINVTQPWRTERQPYDIVFVITCQ